MIKWIVRVLITFGMGSVGFIGLYLIATFGSLGGLLVLNILGPTLANDGHISWVAAMLLPSTWGPPLIVGGLAFYTSWTLAGRWVGTVYNLKWLKELSIG